MSSQKKFADALVKLATELAQPFDPEDLVRDGVLAKAGKRYQILKQMPRAAGRHVTELEIVRRTGKPDRCLVKFESAARRKKYGEILERLKASIKANGLDQGGSE